MRFQLPSVLSTICFHDGRVNTTDFAMSGGSRKANMSYRVLRCEVKKVTAVNLKPYFLSWSSLVSDICTIYEHHDPFKSQQVPNWFIQSSSENGGEVRERRNDAGWGLTKQMMCERSCWKGGQ